MISNSTRAVPLTVVASALQDVWNTGDVDALDDLLAESYVRHGRTKDIDKRALKTTIQLSRQAFPDLHTEIHHMVHEDDVVATHWRSVGTHRGAFYDLPVTNKTVTISGMTFSKLIHGRIAEEWESWDGTDLFASLGVVNLWEAQ